MLPPPAKFFFLGRTLESCRARFGNDFRQRIAGMKPLRSASIKSSPPIPMNGGFHHFRKSEAESLSIEIATLKATGSPSSRASSANSLILTVRRRTPGTLDAERAGHRR